MWRRLQAELVCLSGGWDGSVSVFALALEPGLQTIHINVNNGRGEESEHLADDETADDGDAERTAKFGTDARAQRQG